MKNEFKNIMRYDIGRCASCGDCNKEAPEPSANGEWVKAADIEAVVKKTIGLKHPDYCTMFVGGHGTGDVCWSLLYDIVEEKGEEACKSCEFNKNNEVKNEQ